MSKRKSPFKDPFAAREAEKYENPIPSRELILELLAKGPKATNQNAFIGGINRLIVN